jgi:uncharacterized membrane protein YbhN (UPF0104 family)
VTAHPHRPWVRRAKHVAFALFLVVVAVLLVRAARSIAWQEVWAALHHLDATTLATALLLTAASYLLYTGYDVAARAYAGHHVATRKVMAIAFVAYAFALNIGALVGGAGFRLRMYGREGVPLGRITRVIVFCVATNWIGYIVLAGALFASGAIVPPPGFALRGLGTVTGLRLLGVAMLLAGVAYVIACKATHGRIFHVRGHHFRFPTVRLALLQIAMAATNWALMGAIVARFLPRTGDAAVLAALLLASVATAVAHIPAGIGVLEAVFIALLGHGTPKPELVAALLAYRACYYLVPLVVATIAFAMHELGGRPARPHALR